MSPRETKLARALLSMCVLVYGLQKVLSETRRGALLRELNEARKTLRGLDAQELPALSLVRLAVSMAQSENIPWQDIVATVNSAPPTPALGGPK